MVVNRVKFTRDEILNIKSAALAGHNGWDNNPELKKVKDKIKDFSIIKTNERCCYCGRNVKGEFRMVLDIEHILPKSLYLRYMFTMKNLSVACKRCNMSIKKNRVDFLEDSIVLTSKVFKSKHYKFIHPNLDKFDAHLLLAGIQLGKNMIVKYHVVKDSDKGKFNYAYFKLDALEKDSFDRGQGGRKRAEINNQSVRNMFNDLVL
ncbi:MAG: HNH endonuclease [Saccharospirillum sp.]|uniref:HNH endonuclease n=1 Tax=Saccharospirillum sp. TaxID=2033801 RepID=UPI00329890B8